jgi:hypothetical protein
MPRVGNLAAELQPKTLALYAEDITD